MKEVVIVLSIKDMDALGSVRTIPYLKAAFHKEQIWICGIRENEKNNTNKLPSIANYTIDKEGNLFPIGKLTPVGKIPKLSWLPISTFIPVVAPTSAFPGKTEQKHKIKLISTIEAKPGNALLTELSIWKNYAEAASEVRLNKLRFAVSANKEVLIIGEPLPSIPGKEYWIKDHILIPSGYDFDIPMISGLLLSKLNPSKDSLLLFEKNGEYQKISTNSFVPSTRSSIRLTMV
jgi:hypothetical protein